MRVFLSGRFSRRDELVGYAGELRSLGITVGARWLEADRHGVTEDELMAELAGRTRAHGAAPVAALIALETLEDLRSADALVAFSEPPRTTRSRGGHHVELGMALAWGKPVLVVGPLRERLPRDGWRRASVRLGTRGHEGTDRVEVGPCRS